MNICKLCKKEYIKNNKNQCYCNSDCAYLAEKKLKKIRNSKPENKYRGKSYKQRHFKKLLEIYNNQCLICKTAHNLTIDHIKPQIVGGGHNIDNLRILCMKCNRNEYNALVKKSLLFYFEHKDKH